MFIEMTLENYPEAIAYWDLSVGLLLWVSSFTRYLETWPIGARLGYCLTATIMLLDSVQYLLYKTSMFGHSIILMEHLGLSIVASSLCLIVVAKSVTYSHHRHYIKAA